MQQHYQVNIYDFFTGVRSWRQFYNFLDRLPSHLHYKTALAMDEEWASYICDQEEKEEELPPGVNRDAEPTYTPLGYSEIVARLDLLADRVMAVRTAVQAGYSKDHKEPYFEPMQRPTTALELERERRARDVLEEVNALLFGPGLSLSNVVLSGE